MTHSSPKLYNCFHPSVNILTSYMLNKKDYDSKYNQFTHKHYSIILSALYIDVRVFQGDIIVALIS